MAPSPRNNTVWYLYVYVHVCVCVWVCVCAREREVERERAEDCLRADDVYDSDADNGSTTVMQTMAHQCRTHHDDVYDSDADNASRPGFFDVQNIGRCRCM